MRQPHSHMDRRPTGDTVPPLEPAVTTAITGSRTVGSVRALTVRKFLVSSLRSVRTELTTRAVEARLDAYVTALMDAPG